MLEQGLCGAQVRSEPTAWRQEGSRELVAPSTTEMVAQEGVQWVKVLMEVHLSREVESGAVRLRVKSIRVQACLTG